MKAKVKNSVGRVDTLVAGLLNIGVTHFENKHGLQGVVSPVMKEPIEDLLKMSGIGKKTVDEKWLNLGRAVIGKLITGGNINGNINGNDINGSSNK